MPVHTAICPLCEATCGLSVSVEQGRVQGIRGNPDDVFSRGYLCPKGYALKALEEDPDRLRAPQIRTGEEWREASWEEAYALIGERLPSRQKALYLGNPNVHNLAGQLYVPALARALQSPHIYSASTLDQMPKHISCRLMFGHMMSIPVPDLDRMDFLLMLGANPLVSNGSLMTAPDIKNRLRGIRKIVVLDPRRTRTAELAAEHHFLRPGSDALLLFAMAHTLFQDGLDRPRYEMTGYDTIKTLAEGFSPDRVAARCGLEAETIRRLARELAASPRAAVYGRLGTCTQEFGTLASWLVDVLNVLTGNLDREGGAMFPRAATETPRKPARPVAGPCQLTGELPTAGLADAIFGGQVNALVTVAGNPILSAPDSARLEEAFRSLEFMVSVDCYRNETTTLADVILPPPSHLQRPHYDLTFSQLAVRNVARFAPAVLPLEGPDEWEILLELAALLTGASPQQLDDALAARHAEPPPPGRGPERLLDLLLRQGPYGLTLEEVKKHPNGLDLGPLQPRMGELFPSLDLAPAPLVNDVSRLAAALEQAPPELVLIGRRELRSNNSWMHNLPLLVKGPHPCTLLVHPSDAARLGLGATACVSTEAGQVIAEVEVTDTIMPGVVSLPHGWGHDRPGTATATASARPGVNLNTLVPARVEPLSGTAIQNGVAVQVGPAER